MFAQQAPQVTGERKGTGKKPRRFFGRQKRRAGIQISLKVLWVKKVAESAKIRKIHEIGQNSRNYAINFRAKMLDFHWKNSKKCKNPGIKLIRNFELN